MTFTGEYRGSHEHGHEPILATHSVGGAPSLSSAHAATSGQAAHPDSRGPDPHAGGHAGHQDHPDHKAEGAHGHGGMPHESPKSMTYVLATLAIGCAATIILGFWAPLGHLIHSEILAEPLLERWLEPVLRPSTALVNSRSAHSGSTAEWILIFLSVGVAFAGWLVARAFYKDAKSSVPATLKVKFPRIHEVVYNKYYVDELYQATVLRGTMLLARAWSTFDRVVIDGAVDGVATVARFVCNIEGAIDKYIVDGMVNLLADAVLNIGRRFRRLQDGRIQHYLYAAVAGALILVGINFLIHGA